MPPIALIIIPLVIIGTLIYAATKPNTFRTERSATINATPAKIFGNINDLSKWQAWSPWEKLDKNVKRTLSEPPKGVGAVYAWGRQPQSRQRQHGDRGIQGFLQG